MQKKNNTKRKKKEREKVKKEIERRIKMEKIRFIMKIPFSFLLLSRTILSISSSVILFGKYK